ncbi:lipocalin family protein [Aquimarina sp. 2201CG14-23]|uniref:lipocalin family protein n=1 Tax=Aquimarina mycalae TaxID=3040073 RepID=UPI002477D3A4|nr:lipocalin family protein [Aquimarina sp. 2201CG14-23]MDH7444176.1 lipocalin family protein [Aquimarina sp. 2201CG14-23]
MTKHYAVLLLFLALIVTYSCSNSNKEPYQIPDNATALIAGANSKTWKIAKRYNDGHRMNMAGCFLAHRATYFSNMTMKDNNGDTSNCGPSLVADWEIIQNKAGHYFIKLQSDQLPELMNIDKNYKFFQITYLSKDTLQVQFRHAQFSSKVRTIIDTYVQEDVLVPNRDFHNK